MELKPGISQRKRNLYRLLIVPYGIETLSKTSLNFGAFTFNRTLWN